MKTKTINWKAMKTKVYSDGKSGQYICECFVCHNHFIGDKRDLVCVDCEDKHKVADIRENT